MTAEAMTPEEIRTVGLKALSTALGPDGMIRFLLQFNRGSGDYTAERQRWVDQLDLDAVLENVERYRRTADQHQDDSREV